MVNVNGRGIPPTRVFLRRSLELYEKKRVAGSTPKKEFVKV